MPKTVAAEQAAPANCCTKRITTVSHCDKKCPGCLSKDGCSSCFPTPLYILERFAAGTDKWTYQTCERVSTYFAENDMKDDFLSADFKREVEKANSVREDLFQCSTKDSSPIPLYDPGSCPAEETIQEYVVAQQGAKSCPSGHPFVSIKTRDECKKGAAYT